MVNIGLNSTDEVINLQLKEALGFKDAVDMYLFAMSYAIKHNLPHPVHPSGTKWSSLDWIDLQALVEVLVPGISSEPHFCDNLARAGIYAIRERLNANPNLTVLDFIDESNL